MSSTTPTHHRRPQQPNRPLARNRPTLMSAAALSGNRVSYRQLDYWATTGRIDLGTRNPGTGNWRVLDAAELAAVLDVIVETERINDAVDRLRSGDFFRERLAFHAEHPDASRCRHLIHDVDGDEPDDR